MHILYENNEYTIYLLELNDLTDVTQTQVNWTEGYTVH